MCESSSLSIRVDVKTSLTPRLAVIRQDSAQSSHHAQLATSTRLGTFIRSYRGNVSYRSTTSDFDEELVPETPHLAPKVSKGINKNSSNLHRIKFHATLQAARSKEAGMRQMAATDLMKDLVHQDLRPNNLN